jgi:hypothetical protein
MGVKSLFHFEKSQRPFLTHPLFLLWNDTVYIDNVNFNSDLLYIHRST